MRPTILYMHSGMYKETTSVTGADFHLQIIILVSIKLWYVGICFWDFFLKYHNYNSCLSHIGNDYSNFKTVISESYLQVQILFSSVFSAKRNPGIFSAWPLLTEKLIFICHHTWVNNGALSTLVDWSERGGIIKQEDIFTREISAV